MNLARGGSLAVRWLGRIPYAAAARLQEELVAARRQGAVPDTLLLLEHPPVITLGRSARREHVLIDERTRNARGIEIHESPRGGDVTWHAPGQLVGYPVIALPAGRRDVGRYLRSLERGLILAAGDYGVSAARIDGLTGVWVGDRKLAAIGVRLSSGWIASHGFALNVTTDLAGFAAIVPCGIVGRGVTSLLELTGRWLALDVVANTVAARMAEALDLDALTPEASAERPAPRSAA